MNKNRIFCGRYVPRFVLFHWLFLFGFSALIGCRASSPRILRDVSYVPQENGAQDTALTLDLYLPRQRTRPAPLLIYIHGGGWWEGSKADCPKTLVFSRGYALACINYRLSDRGHFPTQIQDVKQAVRWLRTHAERYHLAAERFGAWGPSAGGHLSALLGTSANNGAFEDVTEAASLSSVVQAVCNWFGPTDFTQVPPAFEEPYAAAITEKYQHQPWFVYTKAVYQLLGGPTAQHRAIAHQANPITYIDPQDPPFLIVHGEKDNIVPIEQSELLAQALQAKGVDVTFVRMPERKHSHYGPGGQVFDPQLIDMALDFFDHYLQ